MPPFSAPTVRDALAALGDPAEAGAGPDPGARLTGVAPDREAGPGDVAWISARHATAARVEAFAGTLLVLPAACAARPPCAFAVSETPRLAFSRLVAALFPERLRTDWTGGAPATVHPTARLAPGAVLGPGVEIGPGAEVGPNAVLAWCTLGENVRVGPNATLGTDGFGYTRDGEGVLVPFPHLGRVVLEAGVVVGAGTCIDRGALGETRVGARTRIDNLVHVAHNVRIGADCAVIARAMIAGSVTVGDGAWIAPSASILNGLTVGAGATVGLGAVVIRDVPPGATVVGNPARVLGEPAPRPSHEPGPPRCL